MQCRVDDSNGLRSIDYQSRTCADQQICYETTRRFEAESLVNCASFPYKGGLDPNRALSTLAVRQRGANRKDLRFAQNPHNGALSPSHSSTFRTGTRKSAGVYMPVPPGRKTGYGEN
jgi:hypothetical protein